MSGTIYCFHSFSYCILVVLLLLFICCLLQYYYRLATKYRMKIEDELRTICQLVFEILDSAIVPNITSTEGKVFFIKMYVLSFSQNHLPYLHHSFPLLYIYLHYGMTFLLALIIYYFMLLYYYYHIFIVIVIFIFIFWLLLTICKGGQTTCGTSRKFRRYPRKGKITSPRLSGAMPRLLVLLLLNFVPLILSVSLLVSLLPCFSLKYPLFLIIYSIYFHFYSHCYLLFFLCFVLCFFFILLVVFRRCENY